jgi:hypothetical protein
VGGLPFGAGGDGCKEPTSLLHTWSGWKNIVEIRDFLDGEAGLWVGTTSLGVEGLASADWELAAAFFLGFRAAA